MLSLNLRYACAWKFNLGILICSYKSVVVVALDFTIKACQTSATSFAVLQNHQWLCNLHELHNKELHSSLSSIYAERWANTTQTSSVFPDHSPSFSKRSSTESRNLRSRIFVSSSGSISAMYSNVTNVLAVKDNMCLGKILQLSFTNSFYKHCTFCVSELIHNFISTLFCLKA